MMYILCTVTDALNQPSMARSAYFHSWSWNSQLLPTPTSKKNHN